MRNFLRFSVLCLGLLIACQEEPPVVPETPETPETPGNPNPPSGNPGVTEATDGIDNDGDGLIDWQFDLGVTSKDDASEGGLPTGSLKNGWTVFTPAPNTKIVYVSSTVGNDALDGFSHIVNGNTGPKRTLTAALAVVRAGMGDWLLLRRGDTWDEDIKLKSGSSLTAPTVISAYGDHANLPAAKAVYGSANFVAVAHIRFDTPSNSDNAISGNHVWVEGCQFKGKGLTIGVNQTSSTYEDVKIRRNTLENGGFYFTNVDGLLAEENVIYKPWGHHGMYITRGGNKNVVTRGNLILKIHEPSAGNGNGIMQRPGGISEGNVIAGIGADAIVFGDCNDQGGTGGCVPGTVEVNIKGNLLIDGLENRGGIRIVKKDYITPGAQITDNILMNGSNMAIGTSTNYTIKGNTFLNSTLSLDEFQGLTFRENIFYTTENRKFIYAHPMSGSTGLVAQLNKFYSTFAPTGQWFEIPGSVNFTGWKTQTGETGTGTVFTLAAPTRTIATYYASIGGTADRDAFFYDALKQVKFNYRTDMTAPAVIAYFKQGLTTQ